MPTARQELAAAAGADGRIYAIGGANFVNNVYMVLDTVEAYDPFRNSWSTVAPMPTARHLLAAVAGPDGRIYAIGGEKIGSVLNTVEAYDPFRNSWSTVASMHTARYGLTAVAGPDGRIYAIGGFDGMKYLNTVEAYNPDSNRWSTVAPINIARNGLEAVVGADGRIYAIGGFDGTHDVNAVEAYNNPGSKDGTWSPVASMNTPRYSFAATAGADGRIYAIGGTPGGGALNTVEAYDPFRNTWSTVAPMNGARHGLAAAVGANGRIYAIGGVSESFLNTVEEYNPAPSWSPVASMNTPRRGLAAVAGADGRIYAIGGENSSGILNTVEAYNPSSDTWSTLASMSTPRTNLAAVAGADGRIYAIGGVNNRGIFLNTMEAYDPFSNTWSRDAPMRTARAFLAAVAGVDGRIYAIGGTTVKEDSLNTVEAYDPVRKTWSMVAAMPTARRVLAAALGTNGRIYVLGGENSSGLLNSEEVYDPGNNSWSAVGALPTRRGSLAAAAGADGRIYALGGLDAVSDNLTTDEVYDPVHDVWYPAAALGTAREFLAAVTGKDGRIYAIGGVDRSGILNGILNTVEVLPTAEHPTTLAVTTASGTYGWTTSFTATLTQTSDGSAVSGQTIRFTLNHASVGSATTDTNGVATLSNVSLAGLSPGTYLGYVGATFAGDTNDDASTGTADLTVNPAPLTIMANNRSKTYGDSVAFAGTEFTTSGLVPGDTVTSVMLISAGAAANASVAGSPYPIVPSAAVGSGLSNYMITYFNGKLTVNSKLASVTPDAKSKVYGSADPTLTGTLTGFLTADNVVASYSRAVGETVLGSPYTISATLSPAAVLSNYTITYNTAKLTISPAALTITANNAARIYGVANPPFTVSYSGFVLGEGPGVLGGTLSFATPAAPSSAPGMYAITPAGLTASNYSITFKSGTLTVTPVPLSANGQNITPIAGAPFIGLVATFTNADPFGGANSYIATITWGDGNSSAGTIANQGGGIFAVTGSNTYADPKSYSLQVLIQHKLGYTTSAATNGTATVNNLGLGVHNGQTASIYFWAGSRGQALISSFNGGPSATGLANWLALTFPNLYGTQAGAHNLFGKSNAQVAAFFQTLYPVHLLDAEVLATAFNVYATTQSLGGTAAQAYGFTITAMGVGANAVNVGGSGAAFGVTNLTTLNVYELLLAVNRRAVNGVLYNGDMSLRIGAQFVFDALNISGGVG